MNLVQRSHEEFVCVLLSIAGKFGANPPCLSQKVDGSVWCGALRIDLWSESQVRRSFVGKMEPNYLRK